MKSAKAVPGSTDCWRREQMSAVLKTYAGGGGHGAFTHFLLEGLKGRGDRDKDGFVRVGELVDFLAEVVPEETRALQHPRLAGSVDTRLPLSVLGTDRQSDVVTSVNATRTFSLEVRG